MVYESIFKSEKALKEAEARRKEAMKELEERLEKKRSKVGFGGYYTKKI